MVTGKGRNVSAAAGVYESAAATHGTLDPISSVGVTMADGRWLLKHPNSHPYFLRMLAQFSSCSSSHITITLAISYQSHLTSPPHHHTTTCTIHSDLLALSTELPTTCFVRS